MALCTGKNLRILQNDSKAVDKIASQQKISENHESRLTIWHDCCIQGEHLLIRQEGVKC